MAWDLTQIEIGQIRCNGGQTVLLFANGVFSGSLVLSRSAPVYWYAYHIGGYRLPARFLSLDEAQEALLTDFLNEVALMADIVEGKGRHFPIYGKSPLEF